jgi:hypothetical protein
MANKKLLLCLLSFLFLLALRMAMAKDVMSVRVGVVLDLKSPVGGIADLCMSMALSDFYEENDNYTTRLALSTKDSGDDVVAAASAGTYIILHGLYVYPLFSSNFFFFNFFGCKKKKEKENYTRIPLSIPKLQNISPFPVLFWNFPLTNIRARTSHWIFCRICNSFRMTTMSNLISFMFIHKL